MAYAKCVQYAIGNPLYHWTHLELKRFFGIEECLSEKTADKIWNEANKKIQNNGFSARELITKSNVTLIATTDDPADTLEYHKKLMEDKSFKTKVVPTFRPDNAINIEKAEFVDYIKKLSCASGVEISSFDELKSALSLMMDKFAAHGCKISDHSVLYMPYTDATDDDAADRVLKDVLCGKGITDEECEIYKSRLLIFLGKEYGKRGWVMQLHMAALRNNNERMFKQIGPDTGFDSIADEKIAEKLSKYLNALEREELLPKTILYTLNPKDNYVLGTMLGNFQGYGIKGKIQFGSGWWFNDQMDGMKLQMKTLANLGALSAFVGMLTDSRSFLSYPRHEYFRRILCSIIGEWVENGEYPEDYELLSEIVKGISYENAVKYFEM
jgi:glucuronate isomerase